jgi:hypothetical protein
MTSTLPSRFTLNIASWRTVFPSFCESNPAHSKTSVRAQCSPNSTSQEMPHDWGTYLRTIWCPQSEINVDQWLVYSESHYLPNGSSMTGYPSSYRPTSGKKTSVVTVVANICVQKSRILPPNHWGNPANRDWPATLGFSTTYWGTIKIVQAELNHVSPPNFVNRMSSQLYVLWVYKPPADLNNQADHDQSTHTLHHIQWISGIRQVGKKSNKNTPDI